MLYDVFYMLQCIPSTELCELVFFLLKISLLEMLIAVGNEHLKIICKWGIPVSSGCKRKKGAAGVPSPGDGGYVKGFLDQLINPFYLTFCVILA